MYHSWVEKSTFMRTRQKIFAFTVHQTHLLSQSNLTCCIQMLEGRGGHGEPVILKSTLSFTNQRLTYLLGFPCTNTNVKACFKQGTYCIVSC